MRRDCENHSDVSFDQYCVWCLDGGGDEWFQKSNFYDTIEFEEPWELRCELHMNRRLRDENKTQLDMLMQRNSASPREGRSDLYREYEIYFNDKIREFIENVVALQRRVQ